MVDTDRQAALALVDRVVIQLVERAAPVRFGLAKTAAERETIYRLRYQVVMAQGWASPDAFPAGMERDEFDDEALHLAGWDRETLIATARLVLPRADRPLPIERAFGIGAEPRGCVVDCTRLLIVPRLRDPSHRVLWGLLGKIWMELRANGFDQVTGTFSAKILGLYQELGIQMRILGAPRIYWGEERYPCMVDVLASLPELVKQVET